MSDNQTNAVDLLTQRLLDGREYRRMEVMEVRALQDGQPDEARVVEGYACTFNDPYTLYHDSSLRVDEQIDARAFDGCDMSDVVMQFDHQGRVYARTSNSTLTLTPDAHGLHIRADLGGTEGGRQLYDEIRGGYITKMSFGFRVGEDRRETVEDADTTTVLRTITKFEKLFDVSAVGRPANDGTEISVQRSADGVIRQIQEERLQLEKEKTKTLFAMEV